MPKFDLLLRGGTLVDDATERRADLAVRDGRIAAVAAPGELDPATAQRVIDVDGALVVPGGVDAHVHFDFGLPPLKSQSYEQGSLAALHGGTTTVVDFAFRAPGAGSLMAAVDAKRAAAAGAMHCDYGLHLIVAGEVGDAELAEVPAVIAAGVSSFKLFMERSEWWPGDGAVAELLETVGAHGGIAVMHCENAAIIEQRTARQMASGDDDYRFTEDTRPDWVEAEGTARAARLAHAAGCPLYVLHVTNEQSVAEIATAQARGWNVFAETCHNYLVFSKDDVVTRPDGANWGNYPPLRPPHNRDALWAAIRNGVLEHVSTDDFTSTLENRNAIGLRLPNTPAGHNGVETRMAVLFTEMVSRRGLPATEFVALSSSRIARRLGLWPQKGSLQVGADADLTVIDPDRRGTFRVADLHTVDYSIWDGYEYAAAPVLTVRRGAVVVEDGRSVGDGPRGEFLPRTGAVPATAAPATATAPTTRGTKA
jgi:dihydropyrimidinase